MKAQGEQTISLGWHAAAFARTDKMKPLDHYLRPPKPVDGARELRGMIQRMKKKQEGG